MTPPPAEPAARVGWSVDDFEEQLKAVYDRNGLLVVPMSHVSRNIAKTRSEDLFQ